MKGRVGRPGSREQHPITCVSWDDAIAFCAWDGGRRLPSEAEWERAARGTASTRYAWGDDVSCSKAVFGGSSQQQQCPNHVGQTPKAVGSTPLGVSAEGAFDLTGNAWEWVADLYSETYYLETPVDNPSGPATGEYHVLRGGSWHDDQAAVTTSNRGWNQLEYFYNTDFGFRCAGNEIP